jgi:uncharacterized protein
MRFSAAQRHGRARSGAPARETPHQQELHALYCFIAIIIDLSAKYKANSNQYPMFLLRLIILLALVLALLWLVKRLFSGDPEPEQLESGKSENMRQCKYCGVHVPESSVISVDDQPYCCQEHADLDQH